MSELRSRPPTIRDLFGMGLERLGMEPRRAAEMGGRAASLAELIPGIGGAIAARRAVHEFSAGDLLGGGLSTIGAIPFVPGAAKNLLRFKGKPVWGLVYDRKTGEVLHGVSYQEAKKVGFHHRRYLPERRAKNVSAGREGIVWKDKYGLQSLQPLEPDMWQALEYSMEKKKELFVPKVIKGGKRGPGTYREALERANRRKLEQQSKELDYSNVKQLSGKARSLHDAPSRIGRLSKDYMLMESRTPKAIRGQAELDVVAKLYNKAFRAKDPVRALSRLAERYPEEAIQTIARGAKNARKAGLSNREIRELGSEGLIDYIGREPFVPGGIKGGKRGPRTYEEALQQQKSRRKGFRKISGTYDQALAKQKASRPVNIVERRAKILDAHGIKYKVEKGRLIAEERYVLENGWPQRNWRDVTDMSASQFKRLLGY